VPGEDLIELFRNEPAKDASGQKDDCYEIIVTRYRARKIKIQKMWLCATENRRQAYYLP
jgi:hypothetical protein